MAKRRTRWSELSPATRTAIVVGGIAELIMTTLALRDLRRRPPGTVRGPKLLWVPLFAVQPFGPILYFLVGRRRTR
ncbi:MAG TPA: PLDc N-terminal domain-containing protein [Acidimicrobiia bacterium]|jgi:hypothetical protein